MWLVIMAVLSASSKGNAQLLWSHLETGGYDGGQAWQWRKSNTSNIYWLTQTNNAIVMGDSMPKGTANVVVKDHAKWEALQPYSAGCLTYNVRMPVIDISNRSNYGAGVPFHPDYPSIFTYNTPPDPYEPGPYRACRALLYVFRETPPTIYDGDYNFYVSFPAAYMEKRDGNWYYATSAYLVLYPKSGLSWEDKTDVIGWLNGTLKGNNTTPSNKVVDLKGDPATSTGLDQQFPDEYVEGAANFNYPDPVNPEQGNSFSPYALYGRPKKYYPYSSLYRMRYISGGARRRGQSGPFDTGVFGIDPLNLDAGIKALHIGLHVEIGYEMRRYTPGANGR
jgi:hypothetical protein